MAKLNYKKRIYHVTSSDLDALSDIADQLEAEAGNSFGEDECNGKRCFKSCLEREICPIRQMNRIRRIVARARQNRQNFSLDETPPKWEDR